MIRKAGVLVTRRQNGREEVLMVRKRGAEAFILPGGKIEQGETARLAAIREISEELGCSCENVRELGSITGVADVEGEPLRIDVFEAELIGDPQPQAEIEELRWLVLRENLDILTSISRDKLIPLLARR